MTMFLQDKILASGIGPGLAQAMSDAIDLLTASGTTQADAYEIRNAINRFTTVASGAGAKLWRNAQPGDEILVYNAGANDLTLYPNLGSSIDDGAINASVNIPVGTQARFIRHNATLWSMQSESAVDIKFIQSGTGAASRTMQDKGRDYLTGADYGVVADGTTDDTTAITNTLAAAVSQKKRAVFTGPMLISSTISIASPVHIVMTGAPGELTHAPDTYFLKKSTMTTSGVTVTAFGVVWEGGGVEGNKAAGATGDNITIQGRSFTGRKVCSRNSGGNNWLVGKSTDNTNADFCQLYDCVGYAATTDNIRVNSNNGSAPEANNGTLMNFLGDSAGNDNIALLSSQGWWIVNCNGTTGGRYGLNIDRSSYTTVCGGEYTANTTHDIIQSANASFTRWLGMPTTMVVTDNATSANKQVVIHRTGLDKNLVAADGNAAGAVRLMALNDAQNATVPFELQGSTFTWIGGTMTLNALVDNSGASGGQFKFPSSQNASSNANTLDDYAEGTFTPGVSFGGGTTGITYSAQVGSYTKIGQRVMFEIYILLSSKGSSSGSALVTGLPFTSNAAANNLSTPTVSATSLNAGVTTEVVTQFSPGGTTVNLLKYAAGSQSLLADTDFTNTTQIIMSGTYRV